MNLYGKLFSRVIGVDIQLVYMLNPWWNRKESILNDKHIIEYGKSSFRFYPIRVLYLSCDMIEDSEEPSNMLILYKKSFDLNEKNSFIFLG